MVSFFIVLLYSYIIFIRDLDISDSELKFNLQYFVVAVISVVSKNSTTFILLPHFVPYLVLRGVFVKLSVENVNFIQNILFSHNFVTSIDFEE